jgi:hypothetical protein
MCAHRICRLQFNRAESVLNMNGEDCDQQCYGGRPHDVTMSRSRLRIDRGLGQRLELSQAHAPSKAPKLRRKFPLGGSDFWSKPG